MRRSPLSVAALVAVSLVLAGCGGGDDPAPDAGPDEQPISEGATLAATWPLTGLDVEKGSAAKKHPPLMVKIDNTSSAAPQVGLGKADLIVEQMVEGGATRLAVLFHSQLPTEVGPVRSMRATDIGIAGPIDASIVASGGAGVTIDRIRRAGIPIIEEGAKGIFRANDRPGTYNVLANLKEVAAGTARQKAARPDDYFPFGDASELPKGKKAGTISVAYPNRSTDWAFEGGTYRNTNSYAADGDTFKADNVLVLRVKVVDAGYTDAAGSSVPESKFEGKGQAVLFHDGRAVRGKWSKDGLDGKLELSSKQGELVVPPGHTWLHLLPMANSTVNFE